jgi:hypothetical protein
MVDAQDIGAPVDIVQAQASDLPDTQPVHRQELQDSIVPQSLGRLILLRECQYVAISSGLKTEGIVSYAYKVGPLQYALRSAEVRILLWRCRTNDRSRSATSFRDLRLSPGARIAK